MKQEFRRPGISRRHFLSGSAALAGISWLGSGREAQAEPPPEITTIRMEDFPAICLVPQYLAEELLYAEGFSKVKYLKNVANVVSDPETVDMFMLAAPMLVANWDADPRLTALAGIHAGCQELFGNERVGAIRDLKGKSVVISELGSDEHVFLSSVAAYVGIDPRKDIDWRVAKSTDAALQYFIDGKADAFLGLEPQPQLLREKKIGHVILNTAQDKPWSHYFCCMVAANKDFVRRYPVATKRALRAFLKASDLCEEDPERAARFMKDKGHEPRYDLALNAIRNLRFNRWREANPEDTLRFHALRLHEVGMIKTHPNKLLAQATDWRFLNELKKELKA